jgi:hypothetical protein
VYPCFALDTNQALVNFLLFIENFLQKYLPVQKKFVPLHPLSGRPEAIKKEIFEEFA